MLSSIQNSKIPVVKKRQEPTKNLSNSLKFSGEPRDTIIISGFPAVGKSHYTKHNPVGLKISDSDSSKFSKLPDGSPNPDWPKNYIQHIKASMGKVDILFVSTHKDTRRLLNENGIPYYLAYPGSELKPEYMQRLKDRATPAWLQTIIDKNWNVFVDDCAAEKDPNCTPVKLGPGQYISDIVGRLLPKKDASDTPPRSASPSFQTIG